MRNRLLRICLVVCLPTLLGGCGGWLDSNSHTTAAAKFKVLYDSEESGNGEIYAVNSDGTGKVNLTNAAGDDEQPTAASDGSVIYYWHDGQMWAMGPDGSNQHLVLDTSATGCFGLRVNRTNTKIAFYTISPTYEAWIVNVDGTGLAKLTDAATTGNGWSPTFNAAGDKILFTSDRSGQRQLYTMNLDGTSQTLLSTGGTFAQTPDVSPDGTKLIFSDTNAIYIQGMNGSNQQTLVPMASNIAPKFAPDGEVVFVQDGATDRTIHVVRADGTNVRLLATDPSNTCVSVEALRIP